MTKRTNFGKLRELLTAPDLIDIQRLSFDSFLQKDVPPSKRKKHGLQEVLEEIFPIHSFDKKFKIDFVKYFLGKSRTSGKSEDPDEVIKCIKDGVTYSLPLYITFRLEQQGSSPVEEDVFMGDLPMMTEKGAFIINGAERVIVSQLHRSPGICFEQSKHTNGRILYSYRIIPDRGSWINIKFDIRDDIFIYMDRYRRRRKFLISTFLRAIGFSSNRDLLDAFYGISSISIAKLKKEENLLEKYVVEDVTTDDGEVLIKELTPLDSELLQLLVDFNIKKIDIVDVSELGSYFMQSIEKDVTRTAEDAIKEIYKKMRPGDPPNLNNAKQLLKRLFFDKNRYDLGYVGRYKINKKLGLDTDLQERGLQNSDIIGATIMLSKLRHTHGKVDDIDHLGNRRVRTVGELVQNHCRVGLVRTERLVRERMTLLDLDEKTKPSKLINPKAFSGVIRDFFGRNQLSQFMDQTNPLAEMTNKRRLSALGPGGLSRERAGFEVRDVHPSHYGRVCPIETPEGPNIGLISSLAIYGKTNKYGFIETPYRKVENGKVTDKVEYLSADIEEKFVIAQANAVLDKENKFVEDYILARFEGESMESPAKDVGYMDVSPKQLVSAAAGIIPFLEHDDANRALMGSNMQRQAVPLLNTDSPYVGTGLEAKVAEDSKTGIMSDISGKVAYVDAANIIISEDGEIPDNIEKSKTAKHFKLSKFLRTNSSTTINQRPIVKLADNVKAGEIIADGAATDQGELALGRNVLVGFMSWRGYNFEDAIVLSERLAKNDTYTSVHISEYDITARDTKLGPEEITRDIPNVSEDALRNLGPEGIVRVGAEVKPGDILAGKITPKSETELAPEERLLRAIFGEKAADVKDSSLYLSGGTGGIVMEVRVERKYDPNISTLSEQELKQKIKDVKEDHQSEYKDIVAELADKLANVMFASKLNVDVVDKTQEDKTPIIPAGRKVTKALLKKLAGKHDKYKMPPCAAKKQIDAVMKPFKIRFRELDLRTDETIEKLKKGDKSEMGIVKSVKVYVASKKKISVGDKMAGRHGNKGIIARIVPEEDMPFMEDGTPMDILLNPLGVPSRMNVGQILETHLGWAASVLGIKIATPVFDGISEKEINELLKKANLPEDGKIYLYDGITGERFAQKITVGQIYMMKLDHLVVNKIHSRAVGPYSLVTQQPLGGKAQNGGQRFGEMEVWALEAYGAAYTLQEILTVKSDDVTGRTNIYESIVRGDNTLGAGIPESFNVLMKEMQSLCLDIRLRKKI
ncbi:MAG: DNA-directed RNA polymerase subunit beta [Verrucomicrobiota bacterium]|nr:DNA-directed RNA polymerase subunit beta [Verrucomicrobiota bacterium]